MLLVYNFFNSLIFSVIGFFVYFFLIFKYLNFRKITINLNLVTSVFLFSLISGSLRYLFDILNIVFSKNIFSLSFYLSFPYLFIPLCICFLFIFEVFLYLSKKYDFNFYKLINICFIIILLSVLSYIFIFSFSYYFFLVLFLVIFIFFVFFLIFKKLLNTKINKLTFFSEILDSTTTSFAFLFFKNSFLEKHFLSNFLLNTSVFLFFILKISFCLIFIYLVDKYIKNRNINNYFKLFIIILATITGFRDLLLFLLI